MEERYAHECVPVNSSEGLTITVRLCQTMTDLSVS